MAHFNNIDVGHYFLKLHIIAPLMPGVFRDL